MHVDHSTKSTKCSLVYHELKSPTAAQRKFRNEFGQDPPSIKRWFEKFMKTGSVLNRKRSARPSTDEETFEAVRVAFHRSPTKSVCVASNEPATPRSTVLKVFYPIEQRLLKKFCSALMLTRTILTMYTAICKGTKKDL